MDRRHPFNNVPPLVVDVNMGEDVDENMPPTDIRVNYTNIATEEDDDKMDTTAPVNPPTLNRTSLGQFAYPLGQQPSKETEYKSLYQMEPDDYDNIDDPYRPRGVLLLDIDHFTDFCRLPTESQQRLSRSIYVRGIPWKILAIPRIQRNLKALGFFLQCNGEPDTQGAWNCIAHATLKVMSKKEGIDDHSRRISHTFYPKENDWGYSQFLGVEHLLNPDNGFIENDTISLQVHVSADAPHGVQWDSQKHTGFVGLKNQGATCYMNSLLQTLFFTNPLRRAVYNMPTDNEENAETSVALSMQRVFYDLQHSDKPVGTKKLTKSFGWDSIDSFMQHDVQELCRVLMDNLETKMKGSSVHDVIPQLFQGRMESFIKCVNVPFESTREETFYDIQLNIRPKDPNRTTEGRPFTLTDAFRDYIEMERMDGENKYDAGEYGLQPAFKGVRFTHMPPVLHLQLMRFQYDPHQDANVKCNDRFEFPDLLDLNEFVVKQEMEDYTYYLHAVLVHSGDFHGGHYVVYMNTAITAPVSRWCKFDDDVVSRSTYRDALASNYGGDDPEVLGRTFTNAYMLVYFRKDAIDMLLKPVTRSDIPDVLVSRFENEKNEEMRRKKEKMDAHLYADIYFVTDTLISTNKTWDLFDQRTLQDKAIHFRMEKQMAVSKLFEIVAEKVVPSIDSDVSPCQFRLWTLVEGTSRCDSTQKISLPRFRCNRQFTLNIETATRKLETILDADRTVLYVEQPVPLMNGGFRLNEYNEKTDLILFLKYFDHGKKELVYCGQIVTHFNESLDTLVPECVNRANLPAGTKLRFYEEVAPDRIKLIEHQHQSLCSERILSDVNDGTILIFENVEETTMQDNCKTFLDDIYNTIEVEIFQNDDTSQFPCAITEHESPRQCEVKLNWTALRLSQFVGELIGWDPQRVLLWRVAPFSEKPTHFVVEAQLKVLKVRDLLSLVNDHTHDPRKGRRYKVYYNKLPIPVVDMEKRRQIKVHVMDDRFNLSEVTIFPEKAGTVEHLLEEAKRVFKFAPGGSGLLRCVYVGNQTHSRRVFQVFQNDDSVHAVFNKIVTPNMYNFQKYLIRIEEIPLDQVTILPHEALLPVSHFEKNCADKMFGVPFLMKVSDNETFKSVRQRIKERLHVSEKEFDNYKLSLIHANRVQRVIENDSEEKVRITELHNATPVGGPHLGMVSSLYLGLDHANRTRSHRGGAEKAIVIHN